MAKVAPANAVNKKDTRRRVCSETLQVRVVVLIMTGVMACFEVSDRALVADFIASFFAVASLDMFERWGAGGAAAGAVLAIICIAAFAWASRKVEAMEAFAARFDAKSVEILGGADKIGPPSLKAPDLRQSSTDLETNMRAAEAVFPEFEACVMEPVGHASRGEETHFKDNLKKIERVREKVRLEYGGDASLVKDLCRGLVVADTVPALEAACAGLQDLARQGVVEICQVKNRLRDPPEGSGPTASGYRDLNVNVRFQGHVCEVQIIHADLLKLKEEQTPVYNLVRSLGLVGPLPAGAPEKDKKPAPRLPFRVRLALGALRWFMARSAVEQGMGYLFSSFGADVGVVFPGTVGFIRRRAPGLFYAACFVPPYLCCAFLLSR